MGDGGGVSGGDGGGGCGGALKYKHSGPCGMFDSTLVSFLPFKFFNRLCDEMSVSCILDPTSKMVSPFSYIRLSPTITAAGVSDGSNSVRRLVIMCLSPSR